MGKRGPKPKPTKLKLFEGNRGKRKLNKQEPEPPAVASLPEAPDWLSNVARAEWARIGPELVTLGLLTKVDTTQLAAYCQAYADVIECRQLVDEHGRTDQTDKGNVVQRPEVGQYHRSLEIMHKFASAFGLSPASRVGLTIDKPAERAVISRKRA